ncbi:MAG: NTP transferase domain-containing protein [Proteobacteria bacterium]|nr:NTP transferase domain-containing protein [Pseudomonadota bacterium]
MAHGIESAMLLAAGLGTRLRPLTLTTPKPLLPLDGGLLIDHQLRYLAGAGIKRVVVNLHHLGRMIRDHAGDGGRYGLEILYSEEPKILGTGGGIKAAARFFGRAPFVVLNADGLTAADIAAAAESHSRSGADATLVVKRLDDGDSYTPLSVAEDGSVESFGRGDHFFTGLSIMGPAIFDALPAAGREACLIEDGLKVLIERKGKTGSHLYEGYFNDLGTPERYERAKQDIADGKFRLLI